MKHLKLLAKYVKVDVVRDRQGQTILHMCCQAGLHVANQIDAGNARFKCAAWICREYPNLLDAKNRKGMTGMQAWQYLCASKIQAGMRGIKTRRVVVFQCARLGRISVLKAIFKQGRTSPFIKDSRGRNIVHALASVKDRPLGAKGVKWALKNFKKLGKALDKDMRSPLHIAALNLSSDNVKKVDPVIEILINSYGEDILSADKYKRTASVSVDPYITLPC